MEKSEETKKHVQEKGDDATKIVNSTLDLISSLSCPPSSLSFVRRLLSSTIGSYNGRNRRNHNPSLIRNIQRNYQRRCLSQCVSHESKNAQRNNFRSSITKAEQVKVEQHVDRVMKKVELLMGRLQRLSETNDENEEGNTDNSWKWMILFAQLAGTCPNQKQLQKQADNLNYLSRQRDAKIEHQSKYVTKSNSHSNTMNDATDQDMNTAPLHQKISAQSQHLHQKAKEKFINHQSNLLLRECLFALQGIDGEYIRFLWYNDRETNYKNQCQEGVRICPGMLSQIFSNSIMVMDAIRTCGECGWLYLRIQSYIKSQNNIQGDYNHGNGNSSNEGRQVNQSASGRGIVNRALCAALTQEISEYHRLLAVFESQMNHTNKKSQYVHNTTMTLRRLTVWLREPTLRLQVLATIADGVKSLRGGQLADALHLHATTHGDPRMQTLIHNVVSTSTVPLYRMLKNWVMEGILPYDSHDEFFIVQCNQQNSNKNEKIHQNNTIEEKNYGNENVWEGKYDFNLNMLPRFIGEELAYEAFIVGKGINFIRICLDDPSWRLSFDDKIISHSDTTNSLHRFSSNSTLQNGNHENWQIAFQYGNEDILFQTLHHASQQINSHIRSSLVGLNHNLMEHLLALKRFFLLGQGDFVAALLDGIHVELNKPASRVYIHNLNAIFDNALRSTNARFLPAYVLDKIQVKLMKKTEVVLFPNNLSSLKDRSEREEDRGWDIFSLDYNVQAPLNAIVHTHAIQQYRRIFHLLWKLKQIEWALNRSWKRANALNHALWKYLGRYNTTKETKRSGKSAIYLLNKTATTRQAMSHFVSNMQSYLLFEVIEGGWKALLQSLKKAKSLDEMIEAHDNYLNEISSKSLLERTVNGLLAMQLNRVFEKCSEFCAWQDRAFEAASDALQTATLKKSEAERRTAAGLWGYDAKEGEDDDDVKFFKSLSNQENVKEVTTLSNDFSVVLVELLDMLHDEINSASHSGEEVALNLDDIRYRKTNAVHGLSLKYRGKRQRKIFESYSEVDDALRFLAFRLDFSEFYNKLEKKDRAARVDKNS